MQQNNANISLLNKTFTGPIKGLWRLVKRSSMQFMIWCVQVPGTLNASNVQKYQRFSHQSKQTNLSYQTKGSQNYFLLKSARVKIHRLLGSYYLWALLLSWTHEMLPCSLGSPADYWMFYTCQEPVHRKLHSKCIISMIKGPGRAAREQIKFRKTHSCFLEQ